MIDLILYDTNGKEHIMRDLENKIAKNIVNRLYNVCENEFIRYQSNGISSGVRTSHVVSFHAIEVVSFHAIEKEEN